MNLIPEIQKFNEQLENLIVKCAKERKPFYIGKVYLTMMQFLSYVTGFCDSGAYDNCDTIADNTCMKMYVDETSFDTVCEYSVYVRDAVYKIAFINRHKNNRLETIDTISYSVNDVILLEMSEIPSAIGSSMLSMFVDCLASLMKYAGEDNVECISACLPEAIVEVYESLLTGYNDGYRCGRKDTIKKFSIIEGGKNNNDESNGSGCDNSSK